MRAIIRITTNLPDDRLDDLLRSYGWLSRLSDQEFIERKRKEILDSIHPDDLPIVKDTLLPYTLLHDPTKTWGIVNRPVDNLITFRLKNPIPDRLKAATEKLVRDLQDFNKHEKKIFFEFEEIEVLEPQGFMHAFAGEVMPRNRLSLAINRRRTEWLVGIVAFVVAAILLTMTFPSMRGHLFAANATWASWEVGFLERLSTSAIVTATVSWLNVILYWFELRRQDVVIWKA